jgi:hypothetical protein
VAVTVAADRSARSRATGPGSYAQQLLDDLPDFEGSVEPRVRPVPGTPYRTARIEGSGTIQTTRQPQRITVAVYQGRAGATYSAVVFRNPRVEPPSDRRDVERMLPTLRGASG